MEQKSDTTIVRK